MTRTKTTTDKRNKQNVICVLVEKKKTRNRKKKSKCDLNAVASREKTHQFQMNNKTKYIILHLRAVKHFIFIFHIWCAFFPHVSLHISFSFDCLTFSACLLSFCCLLCRSIVLRLCHALAPSVSFSSSFPVSVFRCCFCHFCQFQR